MTGDRPPSFVDARDHVIAEVVRFARTLRAEGAAVPANASLPAARALAAVGLEDREAVRAATRATLLSTARDAETFESQFPTFWHRLRTGLQAAATAGDDRATGDGESDPSARTTVASVSDADEADADADEVDAGGDGRTAVGAGHVAESGLDADEADRAAEQVTRSGTYSGAGEGTAVDEETAAGGRPPTDRGAVGRLARALATLPGRRSTPSRSGTRVDVRRTHRRSLSTGGVPMALHRRSRDERALSATVLVDVSQSVLDAVDREFLLSFLDALVDEGRSVRVFFFDTDVREVTGAFERSAGSPLRALERAEVAWGGGTRIGESLAGLRRRWPDAVDRRTVTLVVSDGLDVGEIDLLDREMVRLSRRSGALLWLNPLAVSTAYRPTCRGMAAALPYVDGLFAFGGPADVAEVTRQLERRGVGGSVGYEYDFRDRERRDDGADPADRPGGVTA